MLRSLCAHRAQAREHGWDADANSAWGDVGSTSNVNDGGDDGGDDEAGGEAGTEADGGEGDVATGSEDNASPPEPDPEQPAQAAEPVPTEEGRGDRSDL